MTLVLRLCCTFLLAIALPSWAQTLPQDFVHWASRFDRDMQIVEASAIGERAATSQSLWPSGSAAKYLDEMHAAQQLFPRPRNRVWSVGEAIRFLTKGALFAGSGGTVLGSDLNANLPREVLEVVYLRPPADLGDRLQSALKQRFGVGQLEVPPAGVLRRNEYPFLLFKRIDNKLYLAAFSREFMAVVDAIFTLQIAGAGCCALELASVSCFVDRNELEVASATS